MTELHEVARLIRSKNAGPFELTIDVMFDDPETFRRVTASGVLDRDRIADIYGIPAEAVAVFRADAALAVKFSLPRPTPSGSTGDTDIFGGQFHSPLVTVQLADS